MDWFVSLSEGHIMSFTQLSQLFIEQYLANRAPPPVSYDLFDVKQYQGETLKEYISRFGAHVEGWHQGGAHDRVRIQKMGVS